MGQLLAPDVARRVQLPRLRQRMDPRRAGLRRRRAGQVPALRPQVRDPGRRGPDHDLLVRWLRCPRRLPVRPRLLWECVHRRQDSRWLCRSRVVLIAPPPKPPFWVGGSLANACGDRLLFAASTAYTAMFAFRAVARHTPTAKELEIEGPRFGRA